MARAHLAYLFPGSYARVTRWEQKVWTENISKIAIIRSWLGALLGQYAKITGEFLIIGRTRNYRNCKVETPIANTDYLPGCTYARKGYSLTRELPRL